jgi:hypothetical protein
MESPIREKIRIVVEKDKENIMGQAINKFYKKQNKKENKNNNKKYSKSVLIIALIIIIERIKTKYKK